MPRPSPEEILREDQLIVANFDRAFAELPGDGAIERRWEWRTFGEGQHQFSASALVFTIDWSGTPVRVETGPIDQETRLYATSPAAVELGEVHGPDPRRLADRCAAAVADWLVSLEQPAGAPGPTSEPKLEAAALGPDPAFPVVLWPEPLPSFGNPARESAQVRRLRRGTDTIDAILDSELPRYSDALRRLGE